MLVFPPRLPILTCSHMAAGPEIGGRSLTAASPDVIKTQGCLWYLGAKAADRERRPQRGEVSVRHNTPYRGQRWINTWRAYGVLLRILLGLLGSFQRICFASQRVSFASLLRFASPRACHRPSELALEGTSACHRNRVVSTRKL